MVRQKEKGSLGCIGRNTAGTTCTRAGWRAPEFETDPPPLGFHLLPFTIHATFAFPGSKTITSCSP